MSLSQIKQCTKSAYLTPWYERPFANPFPLVVFSERSCICTPPIPEVLFRDYFYSYLSQSSCTYIPPDGVFHALLSSGVGDEIVSDGEVALLEYLKCDTFSTATVTITGLYKTVSNLSRKKYQHCLKSV